ncbi:MAG: hypothetical protein O3A02_01325 [bacterium]|nr:hypothetical protein [bacterium]
MCASPSRQTDPARWAWLLLASRVLALLAAQALIVAGLTWSGTAEPLWSSAAWWPVAATIANLAGLALLGWRLRAEGVSYRALLAPQTGSRRHGGAAAFGLLPVLVVAGVVPSMWIGTMLWGDPATGQSLLRGPLPGWAALVALLLFPITTAAVELPTYAGYVLPRLRTAGVPAIAAIAVVGLALGIQHGALPFLPASKFFLWRTLMFVPLGVSLVGAVAWRPRLLPWFVAMHLALVGWWGYQLWRAAG